MSASFLYALTSLLAPDADPSSIEAMPQPVFWCMAVFRVYGNGLVWCSSYMSYSLLQVQRALLPSLGGNPSTSLDEAVARLARAKVCMLCEDITVTA